MIPKRVKIWFYQVLANALIKKLERTPDKKKWLKTANTAYYFNRWCVENDIYLK